jgi:hypothetical protein
MLERTVLEDTLVSRRLSLYKKFARNHNGQTNKLALKICSFFIERKTSSHVGEFPGPSVLVGLLGRTADGVVSSPSLLLLGGGLMGSSMSVEYTAGLPSAPSTADSAFRPIKNFRRTATTGKYSAKRLFAKYVKKNGPLNFVYTLFTR